MSGAFDRGVLRADATEVAPLLLGAVLQKGDVAVEITEVEAYLGDTDPGSHAFRGRTARNAVMFGEAGRLYTYFTYGMHVCANVVCGDEGRASAVLIRAGRVIDGIESARARRSTSRADDDLARGPARLTVALGITLDDGGADLLEARRMPDQVTLTAGDRSPTFESGPRTGVSGPGGSDAFPWRFWVPGDPTVSPYRRHTPKRRPAVPG